MRTYRGVLTRIFFNTHMCEPLFASSPDPPQGERRFISDRNDWGFPAGFSVTKP